jgi:hypothetical protein
MVLRVFGERDRGSQNVAENGQLPPWEDACLGEAPDGRNSTDDSPLKGTCGPFRIRQPASAREQGMNKDMTRKKKV